ncbi:metallophosphoesterase [Rubripirellula amarantea]|uniref:Diadenosine tetraphosphatase n=1 Tax=Rubripirellula amarantea TaxID=2527999 RepID=A0A5C5WDB5_9BACT|nr:metallophosphoesterase [Rubripirellula amarantea]MDA8743537.1 metallophosphoesterase [Rubripirellula amarantea]TWT48039.1 diadenosine tetraphosphatase [Rubripirellula amarantea]
MSRFVAVGDIHGCSQTLAKMLEILDLAPGDTFLSTGDLSSKGEDSQGVHAQLVELEDRGINLIVLLGNHEVMLLALQQLAGANVDLSNMPESIFSGAAISCLLRSNEVWATLKSYGREVADIREFWAFRNDHPIKHFETVSSKLDDKEWRLPQRHLDLLSRCRTHHIARNCLFVHSGMRPEHIAMSDVRQAIESQLNMDASDLCWNRDWLGHTPGFSELVIHGHTPLCYLYSFVADTTPWRDDELVFKSVIHDGTLNLDSGVFLDAGHLTAVEIPESGQPSEFRFLRVPRLDPVCKDRLSHFNFM